MTAARDPRDPDESVLLGFDDDDLPTGVTVGTWPTAQVHLKDRESIFNRPIGVRFERRHYIAREGGPQASVSVLLDRPAPRQITVRLRVVEQGATAGDYSGVPASVTFARNSIRRSFTVTATEDTVTPETGEAVQLLFDMLPAGVNAASPSAATVDLLDVSTTVVAVRFERDSYTAQEGGPAAQVAVVLDQAPGRTVTVPLTATNQGGASDADYSGVPASITFAADQTRRTFTVSAPADFAAESGESVRLTFGTLPAGVSRGTPPAATVHLVDAATTAVRVRFERDSYTAQEGGPAAEVALRLDRAPGRELRVRVAVTPEGGASDADYRGLPTTVTFGADDTRAVFAVRATTDTEPESGERLRMSFTMLPAGVSAAPPRRQRCI